MTLTAAAKAKAPDLRVYAKRGSFIHKGQRYQLVGVEPYVSKSGEETTLLLWESHCATCGRPFRTKTKSRGSLGYPTRRCWEHRSPGLSA